MTSKVQDQLIVKYYKGIDDASKIIEDYYNERSFLKSDIPDTKIVVYNRIAYPIVWANNHFYYLGGNNLYMIMKSKCVLKNTGKYYFYEALASQQDIDLGKSPIIPQGCPADKGNVYPNDTGPLERKV